MKLTLIAAVLIYSGAGCPGFAATISEKSAIGSDTPSVTTASNGHQGSSSGSSSSAGSRGGGVAAGGAGAGRTVPTSRPMPSGARALPHSPGMRGQKPGGSTRAPGVPGTRRGVPATRPGPTQTRAPLYPRVGGTKPATSQPQPRISRPTAILHQGDATKNTLFTTRDGRSHEGKWSRNDPQNRHRLDRQTQDRLHNAQGTRSNWTEACHRHNDHHRHHHDHNWWHQHCDAVVLVDWGFWGWNDGWWYPAWGYDANYSYCGSDGPIYGYDGLLPDEIIANVQSALQELGYYPYEVDGVFGTLTQEALARFQRDQGLPVTAAIDPPTLAALGLQ